MIAKWIGLALGLTASSVAVFWMLLYWPVVFVCVAGGGVGLALIAYWSCVFAEHARPGRVEVSATVDGRPVKEVEVLP